MKVRVKGTARITYVITQSVPSEVDVDSYEPIVRSIDIDHFEIDEADIEVDEVEKIT